jgi:DNA-3-methyladenine glycosylase II
MRAHFFLKPVATFRLDLTAWTLRRRADNVVDRWDGETYRRVVVLRGVPVELQARQMAPPGSARLEITLAGAPMTPELRVEATAALERLLGIRIDLGDFYRLAERDAKLGPLVERFRGMKPPRLGSVFETLANAIACQQVTLTLGIRVLNRLAEKYGPSVGEACGFPGPEELAEKRPEALRQLGFSYPKADYLTGIAREVTEGRLDLKGLAKQDDAAAVERLREMRGVGRWTAEYVLLRGLGRLNVFPGDDVGAWNNLKRWLHLRKPLDYAGVRRIVSRWQPYAGLVYFHLLLDRLDQAGYLSTEGKRIEY